MNTPARHTDDTWLPNPPSELSSAAVADLIDYLRRLTDALELRYVARLEAVRSSIDENQLDMWGEGDPF